MQVKLSYTDPSDGSTEVVRYVEPSGVYSIVTTRQNHRYRDEFSGTMKIMGPDFDWIMEAGECTRINVEFEFKRTWNGYFSLTDCSLINRSKRWLDVTPLPDDEYSKFEPWMDLEMNIIPPFNGIDSRVIVASTNQYEIEKKIVRIDEPYTGTNSENWNAYSVNDFIGNGGVAPLNPYRGDMQLYNSLIWKITDNRVLFDAIEDSDAWNRLFWLDYLGFQLNELELSDSVTAGQFLTRYWRESMFTLSEVINVYTDDGEWEYCELIYLREIYSSVKEPPSGMYFDIDTLNTQTDANNILTGRWVYNPDDNKWQRRYLALHQEGTQIGGDSQNLETGDGFDFSDLLDVTYKGRPAKKQVLFRNKYEELENGNTWYFSLYGINVLGKIYHKPTELIKKFIEFIKSEGADTSLTPTDVSSLYLNATTNPYTGITNDWRNVLIAQNSDLKRPLASEEATIENMTFNEFLETLCTLTNSAWAIIDGEFILEHVSYFEKGLTYQQLSENIINPYSIVNTAKNKGFMGLSDVYRYEKNKMPKFEIYNTDGGSEPQNNKTRVEYTSNCVNNKPKENKQEYTISASVDYEYSRVDGSDAGITFVKADDYVSPAKSVFPVKDEFDRWVFNGMFTLEYILRTYHNWGRNDSSALLNGEEWNNLQKFKNIEQEVGFLYDINNPDLMGNPYSLVQTGLGYGIIKNVEYRTKDSWLSYLLGFSDVAVFEPPTGDILDWYIHNQGTASDTWTFTHRMNTNIIFRPVIFDSSGISIEYSSIRIDSLNKVTIFFSEPVTGNAHLIAMKADNVDTVNFSGSVEVDVSHSADRQEDVGISMIIGNDGYEIEPSGTEFIFDTPKNKVRFKFSEPASGTVSCCSVVGYVNNNYKNSISGADETSFARDSEAALSRPWTLMANKEILHNSDQLTETLRTIGFSENVIASIIVMEKK